MSLSTPWDYEEVVVVVLVDTLSWIDELVGSNPWVMLVSSLLSSLSPLPVCLTFDICAASATLVVARAQNMRILEVLTSIPATSETSQ